MSLSKSYYNTTNAVGRDLEKYREAAENQEDVVLAFYQARPEDAFSPDDVQRRVLPEAPLTSVRRAITNLTSRGDLVKTDRKARGRYGRLAYLWRLAEKPKPQQAELVTQAKLF